MWNLLAWYVFVEGISTEKGGEGTFVRCTALAHTVKISLSGFWALVI